MSDIWVENVHEEYEERAKRDQYTRDHYTGAVKDKSIEKAKKLTNKKTIFIDDIYLYRRAQGESVDAYTERAALSKFPRHHATVVDSFSGSIFAVESKADRTLDAFGDNDDESSFAYQLWRNADGVGTNYCTMYKKAASDFTNYKRVWYLVESDSYTWIPGDRVKNWFFDETGALSDVLIEETVDGREGVKDDYKKLDERTRWIHYHKEGFDRYRIKKNKEGKKELELIEDESGLWDYYHYDDIDQAKITVPCGYIDLPIDSHPGYSMAQDANYLYNLLSDSRNLFRLANHPLLSAVEADDELFQANSDALNKGARYLQGEQKYTSPDVSNAMGAYEVYRQEVVDFFVTSHQRYNDSAKEVTATEARQDDQSGRQSYLILLSGSLDELENRVLFLLSQKRFPTDTSKWLESSVTRSTDFKAQDSSDFADKLTKRYFDTTVPIGATGLNNVAKTIAGLDGVEIDDDELETELIEQETEREQQQAANDELESLLDA